MVVVGVMICGLVGFLLGAILVPFYKVVLVGDPWYGPTIAQSIRDGESHKDMYERLLRDGDRD